MAPLVNPVALVISLIEVALYPWVLNNCPDCLRIFSLVISELRTHKDTDRYLIFQSSFSIYFKLPAKSLFFNQIGLNFALQAGNHFFI